MEPGGSHVGLTVHRLLGHALTVSPSGRLVHYRDRVSLSYPELLRRVERLAAALEALGVEPAERGGMGSRVATLEWNTLTHYEAYLAVPMMGAVLHPVNVRLAPMEIVYILNHAGDTVLIAHQDFLPLVEKVAPHARSLRYIIVDREDPRLELPDRIAGRPVYSYEMLLRDYGGRGGYQWSEPSEDTVALMSYTSGTTGLPKGVYHTHRQVVLHALSLALHLSAMLPRDMALTHHSTVLHTVPMFHAYSWGLPYVATLLGAGQVYPGRFNAQQYLRLMAEHHVTHTAGVPTVLQLLLDNPEFQRVKDKIRGLVFMCGGSALPRGLAERAWREGIKVVMSYGMTETAPVLTVSMIKRYMSPGPEERLELLTQKAGVPLPLTETMVADESLNPVPRDGRTVGEVVTRAPWAAREYYRDPERTGKAWRGGWFHTGDLAVWDTENYIQIVDREKDIIKSGGEWISSLRLESLISLHPCVREAAVVAAHHPKWQERPVAVVVPREECSLQPSQIVEHLKQFVEQGVIPKWWLPDKVIIASEIPKTSVGKPDKKKLREKYWNTLTGETATSAN